MLVLDNAAAENPVVDFNLAALQLFGVSREQITGLRFQDLCPPQQPDGRDSSATAGEYARRAAGGESVRYQWRFLRRDGEGFDADVTLSSAGEDSRQLAVIRDRSGIPAVAELEAIIRERTWQLNALNGELDDFSYAVSHDLRAAIAGIAACSEIVVKDYGPSLNEEGRRWLGHIHDDATQLDKLTEALTGLSRISRKPMAPEELDLTAMAREIARDLESGNPGRRVEFHVSEGLKATGDPVMIRTLLRNLLDNAWKFSAKITNAKVEFGRVPCEPPSNSSVFYIRDNGVGFNMADAGRLFVPFQRLHHDPACDGSGIGLSTVRRVAHRHGGKIWAEGKPGAGATFFFTLDLS